MKRTSSDSSLNKKPAARPIGNPAETNTAQRGNLPPITLTRIQRRQNREEQASRIIDLTGGDTPYQILPVASLPTREAQTVDLTDGDTPVASLPNNNQELNNHRSGYNVINIKINNPSLVINNTPNTNNQPTQGNTGRKDLSAMLERYIANAILEFSQATTQIQPQTQTQTQTPVERINFNIAALNNYIRNTLPIPQNNQDEINSDALFWQASGDSNTIVITRSSHFRDLDGIRNFQTSIDNISNATNDIHDRTSSEYILLNFLQNNPNANFYNGGNANGYR